MGPELLFSESVKKKESGKKEENNIKITDN
jgi:hypothetical protein